MGTLTYRDTSIYRGTQIYRRTPLYKRTPIIGELRHTGGIRYTGERTALGDFQYTISIVFCLQNEWHRVEAKPFKAL
jgi:hypothetical protein